MKLISLLGQIRILETDVDDLKNQRGTLQKDDVLRHFPVEAIIIVFSYGGHTALQSSAFLDPANVIGRVLRG